VKQKLDHSKGAMHAAHERYLIFERYVQLLSPLLFACASEITCFLVDCAWALRPVGLPDSPGNARDRSDGKSAGHIRDARRVNLARWMVASTRDDRG